MHNAKPAAGAERRAQVRYPHHSDASCRPLGAGASRAAAIKDVSCGGATLLLGHEVGLGAVLEVMIEGHGGRFSRPLLMRVRHVSPAADGGWQAGCSFVRPLAPHDLEVLMLGTALSRRG